MKKILITGATSSHGSMDANNRTARFAGLLNSTLSYSSNQSSINFCNIDTDRKDLENNDLVIVGLAPISSLSANKIYSALHVVNQLKDSGKLKIMLDAPDPYLVFQSFKSVLSKPELLTKDLYSSREGYSVVATNPIKQKEMLSSLEFLLSGAYDIITPSLPYYTFTRAAYGIPEGGETYAYNFDSLFLNNSHYNEKAVAKYWLAETLKTKWAKDISMTVSKPVLNIKRNAYETRSDYISRIQKSYGFFLNTYKNDTPWWSANLMLALSCGVPVFSDWRHTSVLGETWSLLAHSAESMSPSERFNLSQSQLVAYSDNLTSIEELSKQVVTQLL